MKHPGIALASALAVGSAQVVLAQTTAMEDFQEAAAILEAKGGSRNPALDAPRNQPLDQPTIEFLQACAPALQKLREAAKKPVVEAPINADMQPMLGHLSGYRRLAILAVLQSAHDLQQGRHDEAVDHLVAALALARHIGHERLLVARLVEVGTEEMVIRQLAHVLPSLPKESLAKVKDKLAALPPPVANSETLKAEFEFARQQPGMAGQLKELEKFYNALDQAADLPPADFAAAIDKELAGVDMFVQMIGPSLHRFREPQAAVEAKRAMLFVAINVLQEGPDAVKDPKDPFGDGPFEYVQHDSGFILRSKLIVRQQPAELFIPTAQW